MSACCGPCDSAHHEPARDQLRPRQGALQAPFAVLRQTPAARHPGEGPLHDPAAMQNRETFDVLGFFDDLKNGSDAELRERGRQLLSSASAVRPDFLDVRRLLQHSEDHRRSSVPILHRSRVDGEPEREPLDVHDEVALAPLGLLARVVARKARRSPSSPPTGCRSPQRSGFPSVRPACARGHEACPSSGRRSRCGSTRRNIAGPSQLTENNEESPATGIRWRAQTGSRRTPPEGLSCGDVLSSPEAETRLDQIPFLIRQIASEPIPRACILGFGGLVPRHVRHPFVGFRVDKSCHILARPLNI